MGPRQCLHIRQDLLNWDIGYPESRQLPDGRVLTIYYYNLLGRYYIGGEHLDTLSAF